MVIAECAFVADQSKHFLSGLARWPWWRWNVVPGRDGGGMGQVRCAYGFRVPVPAGRAGRGAAGSGSAGGEVQVPDGWTVQAFVFALDCTPGAGGVLAAAVRRAPVRPQLGRADPERTTSPGTGRPAGRRRGRRWPPCGCGGTGPRTPSALNAETGQAWWPEISKEAFADGIRAAVDGYWNWQRSRSGKRAGKRDGVPEVREEGPGPGPGHLHHRCDPGRAGPPPCDSSPDRDRPDVGEHPQAGTAHRERAGPRPGGHGVAEGHAAGGGVPGCGPAPPAGGRAAWTPASGSTSACGCSPPSLTAAAG